MRDVKVEPQSWDVVEGADSADEAERAEGSYEVAYSFSYARI
ncbi:hypothetical protein [Streptomyces luteogriseus]